MTESSTLFDDKVFLSKMLTPGAQARQLAEQRGLAPLSDDHWRLLEALRQYYFATGAVPVMRHLCRDSRLQAHGVTELLANRRLAWQIAGLPDPGEEARVYLETAQIPG